jgi:hypothetical protein
MDKSANHEEVGNPFLKCPLFEPCVDLKSNSSYRMVDNVLESWAQRSPKLRGFMARQPRKGRTERGNPVGSDQSYEGEYTLQKMTPAETDE